MRTITGKNNIVLVERLDGSFNDEIQLDPNTSLITGGNAHEFNTQEELRTFIAGQDVAKFPVIPAVGEPCQKGKTYAYGEDKAKCLQDHSRMHYPIEDTPALWLVIQTIAAGYPEWKQPTGGHDAYQIGDRVRYNGADYESKINANTTKPDGDIPYNRYWKPL